MIEIFSNIVGIVSYSLLVAGLIVSKKFSFSGGFYFFLILIINELYLMIKKPFISNYVASGEAPMGLTLGEYITWLSYILSVLEILAFSFLIFGLYRLWKSKNL